MTGDVQNPGRAVKGRIKEQIRESGFSLNQIAKNAEVSYTTLRHFMQTEDGADLDLVLRLCYALNLNLAQLTEGTIPQDSGELQLIRYYRQIRRSASRDALVEAAKGLCLAEKLADPSA